MKFGYLNEMCDECEEAATMGIETSCCGGHEEETCDMCGMHMVDNVCACCSDNLHGHHDQHDHMGYNHMYDGVGGMFNAGMDVREGYEFDKFMDNILIKEARTVIRGDSPMRKRAIKHQEKPLNRVRYGVR